MWSPLCAEVVGRGDARAGLAHGGDRREKVTMCHCSLGQHLGLGGAEFPRVGAAAVSGAGQGTGPQGQSGSPSMGTAAGRGPRPIWGGKWGFGWVQHPCVASWCLRRGGASPLLPCCPWPKERAADGQKRGKEGCEGGERGRQKEAKPTRWEVTI